MAIIRTKLPQVNERLAVQVAQAIHDLRENEAILKKPSIAETLDWVSALEALGIDALTPEAMERTAGFVLKNSEDLEVLKVNKGGDCGCGEHGDGHHCGGHHHGHSHGCGHHHQHAEPDEADKILAVQQNGGRTLKVPRDV